MQYVGVRCNFFLDTASLKLDPVPYSSRKADDFDED